MSVVTVNDLPALEGEISLPRQGAWRADLIVPSTGEDSLTEGDSAIIVLGTQKTLSLTGTVKYGGYHHDDLVVRVVGGKGGLGGDATPKFYSGPTVRVVLSDLARGGGETLASDCTASVAGKRLDFWTTILEPVSRQIGALVAASGVDGAVWRVKTDGSLWVGVDSWADAGVEYDEMAVNPHEWKMTVALEEPTLLPGTTLANYRISYVTHRVSEAGLLTTCWFEE